MSRTLKGVYTVKNKDKYIGTKPPVYRSTWELAVMRIIDNHPNITQWAYEPIKIPYYNPIALTENKYTVYVPDFLIIYQDKDGNKKAELLEIKPKKYSSLTEAKSLRDKAVTIQNLAKWKAAEEWCKKNGFTFRLITEDSLFRNHKKTTRKKRKK